MKNKKFARILSWLLVFAMILTLQPFSAMPVKAEGESSGMNVTLHFKNPGDWITPVFHYWGGDENEIITGDGEQVAIEAWDGNPPATKLINEGDGWYKITVQGTIEGFLFVDLAQTDDAHKVQNPEPVLNKCKDGTIQDVYLIEEDWYTDVEGTELLDPPTPVDVPEDKLDKFVITLVGQAGLVGSEWKEQDTNNDLKYVAGTSTYTITKEDVPAGTYQYKIIGDRDWEGTVYGPNRSNRILKVNAPADVTFTVDVKYPMVKPVVKTEYIEFIDVKTSPLKKGESLTLNATYYKGDGQTSTTEGITFATKETVDGVKIEGNKVTVEKTVAGTELDMVATCGEFTQDFTIKLLDKTYKVNFYLYSQDFAMEAGKSDIYIFDNGGTGGAEAFVDLSETFVDEANGITWLKGSVELPYNDLGIIGRVVAGSWDGGQDGNQYYTIDPSTEEETTLWYVYGKTPVTEKPTVIVSEPRYFHFEYENKNLGDKTPKFYSWDSGNTMFGTTENPKTVSMTDNGDGRYSINFKVSSTCSKVSYVLVYDDSGSSWIKDGGDHAIEFPLDQTLLCVSMKEGQEPELSAPYNIGYETQPKEGKIAFYYRDEAALLDGTLSELQPTISVNGVSHDMTYNAEEKRFTYAADLAIGRTYYYYNVNDEIILDKFNDNVEMYNEVKCSYLDYYKLDSNIAAEVKNKEFNYNENNVVKLVVPQSDVDESQKIKVTKASIDLSSLGGASKVAIDPEIQAITISATSNTELGKKTLPIVVTDQYGNEHNITAEVTLVKREKTDKDFDWDEAVIYFMLTDRFFDGNTANNTASGTNTYGKDDPGLYHGGDFAGLTAKLDYLDDLGVNTIWISPIVENIPGVQVTEVVDGKKVIHKDVPYNAAYHGYWASDFTKINPTMGTEEEFKTLIAEAHNRGMKIMVDVVLNHAGYEADENFGDMIRVDNIGQNSYMGGDEQGGLPDFVTENPKVREQLVKWQTDWMTKFDIDYYRVDTVKHVESTTWVAFKNALTEANPSFKLIGEYYGAGAASNGGTLGTGQMDSTLDFDFNDWASIFVTGNISAAEKNLTRRNAVINNTYMTGQFLGSHDEIGFKQNLMNGGKSELDAAALSMVAATLQITAKGQPVIYYGEELGQTGENNYPYQTNRYDLDWAKATDNNTTYNHYKKLLSIRNAYTDVFARGDRTVVDANDEKGYDIVKRTYADQSVWVAMNIKNRVQNVTISGLEKNANYVDLYSDTAYTTDADGKLKVTIPKMALGGTVILAKQDQAAAVTLDKTEATIEKGKELKLTATVSPDGAKDKTVVFTSDNEKVATVTEDGVVKAIAAGTANITATTVNGKTATCKVTVTVPVKKIYLNQSLRMKKGDTLQLTATVVPADATDKLTWKSSNPKKVTVSDTGKIKAVAAGSATITVTSESGKKTTCKVTVEKKAVKATKVTIKKTSKTMKVGEVKQLKLTVKPSRTTDKITFKSSKKKVISVAKNGVMTAKKPGKATITATVGKKKATITITVKQPATGIKLNETSATLKKGKTLKLKATITPGNSTDKVTFKSSKKSVATVNSKGVVTAKKKGTATITAKTTSGKTAKCKITVK